MKFPGFGQRVAQAMRDLGYWNSQRGRPDVSRFALRYRYRNTYLYEYLRNRFPGPNNIMRLARDLEVPRAWLVFGDAGVQEVLDGVQRRKRQRQALPTARQQALPVASEEN